MSKTDIKITWRQSFHPDQGFYGQDTSLAFEIDLGRPMTDEQICELVYRDTNLYAGPVWDLIQPILPADRRHTALSTHLGPIVDGVLTSYGDLVEVNGQTYECAEFGWKKVAA